jgi:hypothetical protein
MVVVPSASAPPSASVAAPNVCANGTHRESDGSCVADAPTAQTPPAPTACDKLIPGDTDQNIDKLAKDCVGLSVGPGLKAIWSFFWVTKVALLVATLAFFGVLAVYGATAYSLAGGLIFALLVYLGGTIWGGFATQIFSAIGLGSWPQKWVVPQEVKEVNPFVSLIIGGGFVFGLAGIFFYFQKKTLAGIVVLLAAVMFWGFASGLPGENVVKMTNHAVYKWYYPHAGEGLSQVDALLTAQEAETARLKVLKSR